MSRSVFSFGRRSFIATAVASIAILAVDPARADEALVAVAANFAGAVKAIAAEFAKDTGDTIQVTTGATGKLYAQIGEGAPFAILLSADAKTPAKLEEEGQAVAGSRFTYAVGKLSLWSSDADRIGDDPKAALTSAETLFVAIANPDLAPYGEAAREALTAMGLWETIQPKIVMGENIGQTFSLVDTGAAQMGFVATSAIQASGSAPRGSRYDVPQEMFAPIRQDAILLKAGESNKAAIAFMEYLKGDKARAIVAAFGYDTE
jgi:molybdate transport system substrate-binding protein